MWYFQNGSGSKGPLDDQQVQSLIRNGSIAPGTLVWQQGMEKWVPAEETGLREYLREFPPEPPAPEVAVATARLFNPLAFTDPRMLATLLTSLLLTSAFINAVALISGWQELQALQRLPDHTVRVPAAGNSASDVFAQTLALLQLGSYLLTAICFARWIYVSARNVRALGAEKLRFTPGWALGFYFIPIANLWKPYQAMREICRASEAPGDWQSVRPSPIIGIWWAFWIGSLLSGQVVWHYATLAQNVGEYILAVQSALGANFVDIMLCLVAARLVREITMRQLASAGAA